MLICCSVGGEDTAQFCRQNKKIFPESLKSMLDLDTLIAVCLHAEETFHLAEAGPFFPLQRCHVRFRYLELTLAYWYHNFQ